MQKILLSVLLILAIFAVPMIAQDTPEKVEPKKEAPEKEVDPKVKAEMEAWAAIQDVQKKLSDRSKPRAELMKIYAEYNTMMLKYVEEHFGVNHDNTKMALNSAMRYLSYKGEYDEYMKLTDKCLKADFFDDAFKEKIHYQCAEMMIKSKKYKEALEEIKDFKLKDGEMTDEDRLYNANLYYIQARANFMLKNMDEFKRIVELLNKIKAEITDDKAKRYLRYYLMKIAGFTVGEGTIAPIWKAIDFESKEVKLSDFKGKYVLLDFWATWCGPCLSAMKGHLNPMYEKYKELGDKFVIVSIGSSSRETIEKQKEFVAKNEYKWNFVYDKDGSASESYGVTGIPTLVFIDPEGKIIFRGHGAVSEKVNKFLDEKFNVKEKEVPKKKDTKEENF